MNNKNVYIAPKFGKYTLEITDKKTKETTTYQDEDQNNLIQIMDQFPRSKYSRKLTGSDIYLYEG